VRDYYTIKTECTCHQCGRHGRGRLAGEACFEDLLIGALNETRQQGSQRLAPGGPPKPGEHRFHGGAGSDFTPVLATYSIGERKQPAIRLPLFRDLGEHVADIILIVVTYSPAVGSLSKLNI
jgi:hypothetical protein